MSETPNLAGMVPGFEFLQTLMKGAGSAIPGMSQWVAPTLDPVEIDKRIQELRTVQFWLEQNARLLATTIQALEVQRMTLSTLQSMNMPLADVRNALQIKPAASFASAPEPAPSAAAKPEAPPAESAASPAKPAVDPLQWWNALTQQFSQIAAQATKGGAAALQQAQAQAKVDTPVVKSAGKTADPSKTRARKTPARKRAS